MLFAMEKPTNLVRNGFTLPGAIEAFLDPMVVVSVLLACTFFVNGQLAPQYLILALLAFALTFPGNIGFHEPTPRMLRKIFTNWLLLAMALAAFGYATGYTAYFMPGVLIAWGVITPFALVAGHAVARYALPRIISVGAHYRTAVVVGMNDIGLRLAGQFQHNPYLATHVMGYFDDRSSDRLNKTDELPVLGQIKDLARYIKAKNVDAIYLALPMASQPRILGLLDDLKDTTASIYFVPDIFVTDLIQGRMQGVGGMPVVGVCESPFTGFNGVIKRLSDIALSIVILILLSPVMLGLAIGVKRSSPGPIVFKQKRYGLDGKEILVYKFRSMTTTDNGPEIKQATKGDQRITRFGAFIRRTSLDELPQFINVIQGRMSIVGPRPHAVAHNEMYRKLIKGYMVRHKVKPGITGWAQVNGYRGETETIDKMEKRIECDLEYLRNWSLGLDLWIIIKTAILVVKDRNAY
jgi:putative colanic acid biosysnthesis UDP-glucose lipid carrier transferase